MVNLKQWLLSSWHLPRICSCYKWQNSNHLSDVTQRISISIGRLKLHWETGDCNQRCTEIKLIFLFRGLIFKSKTDNAIAPTWKPIVVNDRNRNCFNGIPGRMLLHSSIPPSFQVRINSTLQTEASSVRPQLRVEQNQTLIAIYRYLIQIEWNSFESIRIVDDSTENQMQTNGNSKLPIEWIQSQPIQCINHCQNQVEIHAVQSKKMKIRPT